MIAHTQFIYIGIKSHTYCTQMEFGWFAQTLQVRTFYLLNKEAEEEKKKKFGNNLLIILEENKHRFC